MIVTALASLLMVSGQQADDRTQPSDLDTVVVNAERRTAEARATAFVKEVSSAPRGTILARWNSDVCVGVANLASPYAQLVADRVSELALQLGLEIGAPGCRANIMIIFADDATDVARKLVADDKPGFLPANSRVTLGSVALEEFKNSERPIRWWHVSMPVEVDTGRPPAMTTFATPDGDVLEVPVANVPQMSRIHSGVRNDLQRAIIVVDVTKLMGANLASVADYVAMVAMAQINPDVDVAGQSSILALFSHDRTSDSLTSWDMIYLRSLYGATRDRAIARQQTGEISRAMAREQLEQEALP